MIDLLLASAILFLLIAVLCILAYQGRKIARQHLKIQQQYKIIQGSNELLQAAADIGIHTAEICHNLNHFLHSRKLYTELIAETQVKPDYLQALEFSNQNIKRLVTDIQKLLAPPADMKQISHPLQQLLADCMQTANKFTGQHEAKFDNQIPDDQIFTFDQTITEVINNIFINALQAMRKQSTQDISAYMDQDSLCIRDHGPGIPTEDLDKLFTIYYTQQGKSIGLGMGYIQKRCHKNNYHLNIDNTNGNTIKLTPH